MKRFLLGVLLGVVLTLVVQNKGSDILRALGLDPDAVSKAGESFKEFVEDTDEATEGVTEEIGEKVKKAGQKAKKILEE